MGWLRNYLPLVWNITDLAKNNDIRNRFNKKKTENKIKFGVSTCLKTLQFVFCGYFMILFYDDGLFNKPGLRPQTGMMAF